MACASTHTPIWQRLSSSLLKRQQQQPFATYVNNYVKAFGDRLTYVRDVGLTWLPVVFKPSMLDW